MIHSCTNCSAHYLTSSHVGLCDYCGSVGGPQLELRETNETEEWWEICCAAEHGEAREVERRWVIR